MIRYFIVVLLSICGTLTFGQGIAVSPSRIFFDGAPGQTVSQYIMFRNTSSSEFSFVARMQDWDRDSLGVKVYYEPDNKSSSNLSWLKLSENAVQLAPGESKRVNLTMKIPSDPAPQEQTHSMVFFTQTKTQKERAKPGLNVNVLLEIGVQVYHTPVGLSAGDLEFIAFEDRGLLKVNEKKVRQMDVKIKNAGQINKDAYVRFELTNIQTGEEISIKSIAVAMMPQAQQWVRFSLPENLPSGRYLAVAILDAGSQYDLKVAEKEITY